MSISSVFSLTNRLLLLLLSLFLHTLARTLRIKNDEATRSFLDGDMHKQSGTESSFLLFWHNQLLLIFLIMIIYKKKFPPITVLVSSNKSVDIFAALLEKNGYSIIRGSANNKSFQALRGIHKAIKKKHMIAYAADGPTGPIYQFKPGAAFLSSKYKVPIDLININPTYLITFKTWDTLVLPLPFVEVRIKWRRVTPNEFENNTSDARSKVGLNQSVSKLQDRMKSLSVDFKAN